MPGLILEKAAAPTKLFPMPKDLVHLILLELKLNVYKFQCCFIVKFSVLSKKLLSTFKYFFNVF